MFALKSREWEINVTTIDDSLADDLNIRWRIWYKPQGSTNAVIYKDDETGFEANVIRQVNVEQSINEAEALGDYVDSMVQRNGGTVYAIGGTNRLSELPQLASMYDGRLLTSMSYKVISDTLVSWNLTYVKDYVAISSYEGYDSRKRLYQIDTDDVVKRVDRYDNTFILSETEPTDFSYIINADLMVQHLKATRTKGTPPKLANMTFTDATAGEYDVSAWVKAQVLGKTLEWRIEMYDNFSAGFKLYEAETNKWFNQYVPYTDTLGRASEVLVTLYEDTAPSLSDLKAFPEQLTGTDLMMIFQYELNKDAAEWTNWSIQFHGTSDSNNILIYEGFMKYTDLTNNLHENYSPKVAELDYKPTRNSKLIDLTRATVLATEVTIDDTSNYYGTIEVSHANEKPIAIYDENTLELLLVDLRETTDHVIWYYFENQYTSLIKLLSMDAEMSLSADLEYDVFAFPGVDLEESIMSLGASLSYEVGPMLHFDIDAEMSLDANLTYTRTKDIGLGLSGVMGLGASLTYDAFAFPGIALSSQMSLGVNLTYETYKKLPPTINFVSKDENSITFTLTNNDGKALSIFYEIDDDTPDLNNILVGAGATSSEITLSGLSAFTTYTLYAWAYNNGTFSGLDDYEFTTNSLGTTATPTIGSVRCNYSGSVNYTKAYITNNDTNEVTIYRNGFSIGTLSGNTSEYMTISSTTFIATNTL